MGCTPNNGGISLGRGSRLHDPRPGTHLWHHRPPFIARFGILGKANCTSLTLAEWLCRTVDRIDPPRVLGPRYCFGRGTSASDSDYADYYNSVRTHRSLHKDVPISRPIHQTGFIRSHPILGGLHHHYVRV